MTAGATQRLSNEYRLRQARTPKTCFVCTRTSPWVLVSLTAPMYDFFYVCLSHLTDRSFATRLDPSTPLSDEPAVQPTSSSQSNATNEVQAATETLPPKDENPPLHSRYALHREFYAKRVRQFQPARTPIPTFPAVPGTTI